MSHDSSSEPVKNLTDEEIRDHYDAVADDYDLDMAEAGYSAPLRCAGALKAFLKDQDAPVLDFGCATGLCGVALAAEGFSMIDGCDLSQNMLHKAEDRSVYRMLRQAQPQKPPLRANSVYNAIIASDVFRPGWCRADIPGELFKSLPEGGLFCFSLREEDEPRPEPLTKIIETSEVLFHRSGPHMTRENSVSDIWVLRRR